MNLNQRRKMLINLTLTTPQGRGLIENGMATIFKVPVVESEKGWGRKIDDYMLCLSMEDAMAFTKEFNSQNTAKNTPDWYMQVEDLPDTFEVSDYRLSVIKEQPNGRMWLSSLKHTPINHPGSNTDTSN